MKYPLSWLREWVPLAADADDIARRLTARGYPVDAIHRTGHDYPNVVVGEVLEVATDKRAKRYDPNAHHPHHHLVCARCGTIRDVHPTGNPLADLPTSERFGFTVSDVEVTYRGLCPTCTTT